MDQIVHKFLQVNGLKVHIAEIGNETSPVVLFVHGFPKIWYRWRHHMIDIANASYRAIALDCRGYGLSDPPPDTEKFGFLDIVNNLLAIVDSLGAHVKSGFTSAVCYSLIGQQLFVGPDND
ncbi:bifunctional epoxide hydrolase 2-like protein [Tanacetum coccineum]